MNRSSGTMGWLGSKRSGAPSTIAGVGAITDAFDWGSPRSTPAIQPAASYKVDCTS